MALNWSFLLGVALSSIAGGSTALTTALLTDHREKRRWLQTKVHQPMYGELTNVISGETPWAEDEYVSLWAELEYYKTYRVDVELAEALDRYASEVSELARCEHDADIEAFVRALPRDVCEEDGIAALPSGRTIDMRTWLRRNVLVLSVDPAIQAAGVGFEPQALEYLWDEVDGIPDAGDGGPAATGELLEAVSTEFNWGYEGFYRQWEPGWADALVEALLEAAERPDSAVREMLARRRRIGRIASEAKNLIEIRSERGLFRSLWCEWVAT